MNYAEAEKTLKGRAELRKGDTKRETHFVSTWDKVGSRFFPWAWGLPAKRIVISHFDRNFTPHYEPLEEMYKDLRDKGLEILDFPCNQFANQAPGTGDEIHDYCTIHFGAGFSVCLLSQRFPDGVGASDLAVAVEVAVNIGGRV